MIRDYGRSECRDGYSFRGIHAESVHQLLECRRCGFLTFEGRGLEFEPRRVERLLIGSGWAWEDDDLTLTDYPPPVSGDATWTSRRIGEQRWELVRL